MPEAVRYNRVGIRILPPGPPRGRRRPCPWPPLRLALKRRVLAKTGGRCASCLIPLTLRPGRANSMTIDHIRPLSKGGTNHFGNLQPMCRGCNGAKGNTWEGD